MSKKIDPSTTNCIKCGNQGVTIRYNASSDQVFNTCNTCGADFAVDPIDKNQ